MHEPLSLDEVRHVASLARLRLTDDEAEQYRRELSAVLAHIDMLTKLDVDGVAPMSHPSGLTNRLADDVVEPSLDVETLLAQAPAVEGRFLTVPKVLGDGGGA